MVIVNFKQVNLQKFTKTVHELKTVVKKKLEINWRNIKNFYFNLHEDLIDISIPEKTASTTNKTSKTFIDMLAL